jgi:hypothetical protein
MRQATEAAVRPDEQQVSAPWRGQLADLILRGRDARFAVAQDARGSDPSRVTTWNPVNVGLRASGRKALLGVYNTVREDTFWLDKA